MGHGVEYLMSGLSSRRSTSQLHAALHCALFRPSARMLGSYFLTPIGVTGTTSPTKIPVRIGREHPDVHTVSTGSSSATF